MSRLNLYLPRIVPFLWILHLFVIFYFKGCIFLLFLPFSFFGFPLFFFLPVFYATCYYKGVKSVNAYNKSKKVTMDVLS